MKISLTFVLLIILSSCATNNYDLKKRKSLKAQFDEIQKTRNIWSDNIDKNTRNALKKFNNKTKLKNGLVYGQFAKSVSLENISKKDLVKKANDNKCEVINDYIRDWKTKKIVEYQNEKLPMLFIVCPDASIIRLKPKGNPLNKFRPWPHASKSVRFSNKSSYKDFSQEAFKVDNEGNAIPKWPKDLRENITVDGWAQDAHIDIGN